MFLFLPHFLLLLFKKEKREKGKKGEKTTKKLLGVGW